ncbi:fumarylacetoacetate hydrolase family protein [Pendulispora albinea]|uniref:Fumarylacetoacetate hydrolase family protein n=1 Tax=Pendulispora albinea TaxID=2741071 RepID=A0ABZ2LT83_9BACT
MKLVTFQTPNPSSSTRYGILDGQRILDLETGFRWFERDRGRNADRAFVTERYGAGLLGFIERAAEARPAADELLRRAHEGKLDESFDGASLFVPAAEVTLLAPLPRPPSMRDGYAFRQHVETARRNRGVEMIPEFDQFPVFYFTNHQAVVGPGELRVLPRQLDRLDFELEAAIVVGKRGRNVPASRADELIFGLTIMNDFSARVLQMEEMKLSLGPAKGKDFATALGPYLCTLDELAPHTTRTDRGNVFDLEMRAFVNDVQVSRGNVKDMNWTFAQILERASYGATLYPGDVIGSGTCGTGCFLELNGSKITNNQWLQPGDRVALEIDGLGQLLNTIAADEETCQVG